MCERLSGRGKWLRTCKKSGACDLQNSALGRHGVNRWEILGPNGDGRQWSEAVWKKVVKEYVSMAEASGRMGCRVRVLLCSMAEYKGRGPKGPGCPPEGGPPTKEAPILC